MAPELAGIDHAHVYVTRREAAEHWYEHVLGFRRVAAFVQWATAGGPLTLANDSGTIHLALFERKDAVPSTVLAFGAAGSAFLAWKAHLEERGIAVRLTDHTLAWSLYFRDPDANLYEITTSDHAYVTSRVAAAAASD